MDIQLLDLFPNEQTFDNFISKNNEYLINSLKNNDTINFIHIFGNSSSGKSHILKAWTNLYLQKNKPTIYLTSDSTINFEKLAHSFKYIAIDDIDKLSHIKQVELFNLFNNIKLNNLNIFLLTSSIFKLRENLGQDLYTRILSGLNLNLKTLNDHELINALIEYSNDEGIIIKKNILVYLINHYTRNIGLLINIINKSANQATLQKKLISIKLIKQVLNNI